MITNHQINKLEQLLEQSGQDHMPVDVLQGYLAAVGIGPKMIPPSQWLPRVFLAEDEKLQITGDVNPDFLMKAILDFYNGTLYEIQNYEFEPVISENEEDGEVFEDVTGWCRGFAIGLDFWSDEWEREEDAAELYDLLLPILFLGGSDEQTLKIDKQLRQELEERKEDLIDDLSIYVSKIWDFFIKKRTRTVIRAERIGRNDPCPCGSGKKYKQCCGAT